MMSNFLEEVHAEMYQTDRSALYRLRNQMDQNDYNDLLIVLKDLTISGGAIQRTLAKRKLVISLSTLSKVRREMLAAGS